ncbi:hypothetical protein BD324DRAFT_649208 [Kockovaella imperatae]|uniref:Essential protein Yae1 N-terminal domain-containing protein n=1 Tax=Kockovaella imperatae TaxID=4999 RepID=A0A1Y1UM31_9TREE|nr:hypothetical protein BD324DRAFT_649208 [Kockovaella imperatae]ORX39118.1 hypothetical protein BD324DRAFT_649208 [Kockovaella imperatae]
MAEHASMRSDDPFEMDEDPLQEAADVEARFYAQGYDDGHAHGRLHGLFEGRQLGKEKAFELWEEVGFYEGSAMFWMKRLGGGGDKSNGSKSKEARALTHAKTLYEMIQGLPTSNPSPESGNPPSAAETDMDASANVDSAVTVADQGGDFDLPSLVSAIRAKYRLLCASLGIRPRLVAGSASIRSRSEGAEEDPPFDSAEMQVEGIEGPMKGVDTSKLRF